MQTVRTSKSRASQLRQTRWYKRFKTLAQRLRDKDSADILRLVHRLLDGHWCYGTAFVASIAGESVEQVIEDLQLSDTLPVGLKLANMEAEAYGQKMNVIDLLGKASQDELQGIFDSLFEGYLQVGGFSE